MPSAWREGWPNRHLMLEQNWIAASEKVQLRPLLPLGVPIHRIPVSSHIVNEPRAFSAALYAFQFVVRYLLRCLFFASVTPRVYVRRSDGAICITSLMSRNQRYFLRKITPLAKKALADFLQRHSTHIKQLHRANICIKGCFVSECFREFSKS